MSPKVVRAGEHLDEIAYRHGVSADEIWNASRNRSLRERRAGGHMLLAGDFLELPARRHPDPVDVTIGADTTVVATIPKVQVELVLTGADGPLSGEPWHIEARGEKANGTTGAYGKVSFAVRVTTPHVKLVLEKLGQEREIAIGGLDPCDAVSGVIHRLNNLGFDAGPPAGSMSERSTKALLAFQNAHRLNPSGHIDEMTLAALQAIHRS